LWIKIQPLEIFATVAWIGADSCGVQFDEPLDEEAVALLQAKGKVVMIHGLTPDELLGAEDWTGSLAR